MLRCSPYTSTIMWLLPWKSAGLFISKPTTVNSFMMPLKDRYSPYSISTIQPLLIQWWSDNIMILCLPFVDNGAVFVDQLHLVEASILSHLMSKGYAFDLAIFWFAGAVFLSHQSKHCFDLSLAGCCFASPWLTFYSIRLVRQHIFKEKEKILSKLEKKKHQLIPVLFYCSI